MRLVAALAALALLLGWLLYAQVKANGEQQAYNQSLEQGIEQIALQYNALQAQQARDQQLFTASRNHSQLINRLSNELSKKLGGLSGCSTTAIEPDAVEWVRSYRDQNRADTRAGATAVVAD